MGNKRGGQQVKFHLKTVNKYSQQELEPNLKVCPSDPFPPVRIHILKIPQFLKTTLPAVDSVFKHLTKPVGDILHSNSDDKRSVSLEIDTE